MDRRTGKVAAVYIDLSDWRNMVRLFVEVARNGHTYEPGNRQIKGRVTKRYEMLKHLLGRYE